MMAFLLKNAIKEMSVIHSRDGIKVYEIMKNYYVIKNHIWVIFY